jgi:hypothetical protein
MQNKDPVAILPYIELETGEFVPLIGDINTVSVSLILPEDVYEKYTYLTKCFRMNNNMGDGIVIKEIFEGRGDGCQYILFIYEHCKDRKVRYEIWQINHNPTEPFLR